LNCKTTWWWRWFFIYDYLHRGLRGQKSRRSRRSTASTSSGDTALREIAGVIWPDTPECAGFDRWSMKERDVSSSRACLSYNVASAHPWNGGGIKPASLKLAQMCHTKLIERRVARTHQLSFFKIKKKLHLRVWYQDDVKI